MIVLREYTKKFYKKYDPLKEKIVSILQNYFDSDTYKKKCLSVKGIDDDVHFLMKTLIDDVELTSYASSLRGNIGSPHAYIIHFKGSPESYDDEYLTVNSLSVVVKSNVYLNKVEVYVECPDSKKYTNFAVTIFSPVTEDIYIFSWQENYFKMKNLLKIATILMCSSMFAQGLNAPPPDRANTEVRPEETSPEGRSFNRMYRMNITTDRGQISWISIEPFNIVTNDGTNVKVQVSIGYHDDDNRAALNMFDTKHDEILDYLQTYFSVKTLDEIRNYNKFMLEKEVSDYLNSNIFKSKLVYGIDFLISRI